MKTLHPIVTIVTCIIAATAALSAEPPSRKTNGQL